VQEVFPFVDKTIITSHYEKHAELTPGELSRVPHVCDACGQRFSTNAKLSNHVSFRHGENADPSPGGARGAAEPHACPACDKAFDSRKLFFLHVREHELNDQSVFRCSMCDLSFVSYSRLLKHCNDVHKEDHRCKYGCEETFKSKLEIREHYTRHVQERPHSCSTCGVRLVLLLTLQTINDRDMFFPLIQCTVCFLWLPIKRLFVNYRSPHISFSWNLIRPGLVLNSSSLVYVHD
jgi:hypothetical protein